MLLDVLEDIWWEFNQLSFGYNTILVLRQHDRLLRMIDLFVFSFSFYIYRVLVLCGNPTVFLCFYSQKVARRLFKRYHIVFSFSFLNSQHEMLVMDGYILRYS